jgi:GTPase KRas protein
MLEVLDTAGREEYTALRDQWIRDGEGFVLVYSISSRSSFVRIKGFHNLIQRVTSSLGAALGPAPVMLVGNKYDRVTEREVSTQEGSALAKELGCKFIEASAKIPVSVENAFYEVVRQLRQRQGTGREKTGQQQPSHIQYGSRHKNYTNTGGKSSRSCWGKPECVIL